MNIDELPEVCFQPEKPIVRDVGAHKSFFLLVIVGSRNRRTIRVHQWRRLSPQTGNLYAFLKRWCGEISKGRIKSKVHIKL